MDKDPLTDEKQSHHETLTAKELFDVARRVSFSGKTNIGRAALNTGVSSLENPGAEVSFIGREIKNTWALYDIGVDSMDISFLPRRLGRNGVLGEAVMMEVTPLFTAPEAGSRKMFKLQEVNDVVTVDYVLQNDKHPGSTWSDATAENLHDLEAILFAADSESSTPLATP